MAIPFLIVTDHRPEFSQAAGIVAGVFPDRKSQTAIVCIQDQDTDCYNDYRALWSQAAKVCQGDFVVFDIMNDIDTSRESDDANVCISSLQKTNEFLILTECQRLSL